MSIRFSGTQAQTRAARKRGEILRWLWRWGMMDAHVIGKLLDIKKSATCRTILSMEKTGLIARCRIEGCLVYLYHLTPAGAEHASRLLEESPYLGMTPIVYASRLNMRQTQHDLLIQRTVLDLAKRVGDFRGYQNDRMLRHRGIRIIPGKIPDAILRFGGKGKPLSKWALEVIQTLPKPAQRERIISTYADATMLHSKVAGVVYASTSPRILDIYKKIAKSNPPPWLYDSVNKSWRRVENQAGCCTPEYVDRRVIFENLQRYEKSLYQVRVL